MLTIKALRVSALSLVVAAAPLGPLAACTTEKPTQIVAGVTTQMQVPKELKAVGVVVQSAGRLVFCESYVVSDGTVRLPSTLGLVPSAGPGTPVTVTVLGFKQNPQTFSVDCVAKTPDMGEDDVKVIRRRRTPYIAERILYLPLPLRRSCADVKCAADETCVAGGCEKMDVDPGKLVDYNDGLVFGGANTCFAAGMCLPPGGTLPAMPIEGGPCQFELQFPQGVQAPPVAGLNVAVIYDNFSTEVLDLDPSEGFVIPDPSKPLQFRLAKNLCENVYHKGRIAGVMASPVCPSKTPLQPICDGDLLALQAGDTTPSRRNLCVEDETLVPLESALLVVMDRSRSMKPYFGEKGFRQVLELSLTDPVFSRTRVGFELMPAQSADCTASPNAFATLTDKTDVAFLPALQARETIAGVVGDASNVAADDPDLYMDAVMRDVGAYKALADLVPGAGSRFNKKALVLIGNRDFRSHCPAGTSPAALAADARSNSRVNTYVVVLRPDASTDLTGQAPVSDATSIASQGGTTKPFDATKDDAQGAVAIETIASDLGSCLYQAPAVLKGVKQADLPQIKISYFDAMQLMRVDVLHNAQCSESSTMAGGWNLDPDGAVRICEPTCGGLRSATKNIGLASLAGKQTSPGVPVRVSRPCL
jgi:hypothetical protein